MARPPDWHPLHLVQEPEPGVWVLADAFGREHSRIRVVRVQPTGEVRFRAEYEGELIGWSTSLRGACWEAYSRWLARDVVPPFAGYPSWSSPHRAD